MDRKRSVIWKNLFVPGHDACRLTESAAGFLLEGNAAFFQDGKPCSLRYVAEGDDAWQTRSARVDGFFGVETVSIAIERSETGGWTLNGAVQPEVAGQRDLDLGFTPATNLIALRRFGLAIGAVTQAPAAYLLFPELPLPDLRLSTMDQTYRRLDERRYDYAGANYHAVLTVEESGFVLEYPDLWTAIG